MKGRISSDKARQRDHIETAQAELAGMTLLIDEIILRTRQAMTRTQLVGDVLEPAIGKLVAMRRSVRNATAELTDAWSEGQAERWSKNE
jgi:hypothetical protein